jgi:alpha-L-fucosidase
MRIGDFTTPFECTKPTYIPSKWWDECHIWNGKGGGWGYNKKGLFKPMSWFMEHFVAARSLGGNFLINVGPSGTGDMHPNYYKEIAILREWMETGAESVFGTGPTPGVERSNVPLTTRGQDIWYAHVLPDFKRQVSVKTDREPASLTLLRTGEAVPYIYRDGFLVFQLAADRRTATDDVVKIVF